MNTKIFAVVCIILFSASLISALSIKDVESSPSEIMPGETATIVIEIENNFNSDITNLNVKLDLADLPFAPYQASTEKFLDELGSDEDEKFSFQIIVLPEADSGIYKIPVLMTYTDSNDTQQQEEGVISLVVNSEVELKIFSEESFLLRGDGTLSIKIVNSGLADIKFAYVSVSNVVGVNFLSEKEQYIGDVDSDDFDTIEYKIYVNANAPSPVKIPVTIKYRDATNKEFEEQKEISLNVYSLKEAQQFGLVKKSNYTIFIGIGILATSYFVYRFFKKRKLRKRK